MATKGSKRLSVREALRFVSAKLNFDDLAAMPGDEPLATERLALGERFRTLTADGVKGNLFDNLWSLQLGLRFETPATQARGGKPSRPASREALRRVVAIVEAHATDHAPKVASLIVWLAKCAPRVVEPRDRETSAAYLARLTRAIDKRL